MSSVNDRIELLDKLGAYMSSDDETWATVKQQATGANTWFTQESIDIAVQNITDKFLKKDLLENWLSDYILPTEPKTVGIVMAGNIPMVGFHDLLCGFVSGHNINIKLSSKDTVLMKHIVEKLYEWAPAVKDSIKISDNLKNCDGYIATGSNNTSRYFEQYFSKYPNIIRRNRTSVALMTGEETENELDGLGRDIFTYFGLGCRNVTKVYVPKGYDMTRIIKHLEKYKDVIEHHRYRNNYDYYLSIYLLNKVDFKTNDSLLFIENKEPFSPISVLHYEYYDTYEDVKILLQSDDNIQCVVGYDFVPFGASQTPTLNDYADNVDTMMFLSGL